MAEQIGIVRDTVGIGRARVVTDRRGACSGCQSGSGACQSCLASAKLESNVINLLGAQTGDVVKIALPTTTLYKGAAILYLLPIAGLIAGAFAGLWIASVLGWGDTAGTVLGAMLGLGAGMGGVIRLGRSRKLSQELTPTITAILAGSESSLKQQEKPCCG